MIVCGCGYIMKTKKIGVVIEEHLENGGPYKKWMGDAKECSNCGAIVLVVGAIQQPVAHHYQAEYETYKAEYHAI